MVVVAVGLYWWLRHPFAAAVVGVLAGWLLLGLLGVPKLLVWFDRMGRGLSWLIGTGLTWLLLAPFYLIFFGIGGLWLRLTGRDPMCRRRDPVAVTYWNERRSVPVREHFSRQF